MRGEPENSRGRSAMNRSRRLPMLLFMIGARRVATSLVAMGLWGVLATDRVHAGVNQGTSKGSEGFSARALALDPQTTTTLYAMTSNILFKSTNGGKSWKNIGLTDTSVTTVVLDPQTPTTLYVGTGSKGVFKSMDGGENWGAVNTGLPGIGVSITPIEVLALDPQTPTTLYAVTDDGVYKSTNGGKSWRAMNTGLSDVSDIVVDPKTTTTLYTVTDGGVFKSMDGGTSWRAMNTGLTYSRCHRPGA